MSIYNMEHNNTPYILGITGGVGSGKSRILDILETEYQALVIQADLVARELMQPGKTCYEAVRSCLGDCILQEDGQIDRPRMADIIFHDSEKRKRVDELTHPLVWQEIRGQIADAKVPLVVLEAALPGKVFRDICQEMWYVYTSKENRIKRLLEGRGYSREKSESIMDNQPTDEAFLAFCDSTVDNNGTLEETRTQVRALLSDKIK